MNTITKMKNFLKTKIFLLLMFVTTLSYSQTLPTGHYGMFEFTGGSIANASPGGGPDFNMPSSFSTGTDRFGNVGDAVGSLSQMGGHTLGGSNYNNTTLSFWIRNGSSSTSFRERILQIYGTGGNGYKLEMNGGGFYLDAKASNGNVAQLISSHSNLGDNQWHHIVVRTIAINANTTLAIDVFIDGVLQSGISGTIDPSGSAVVHTFLKSAQLVVGVSNTYLGSIDDIYFYKSALTNTEITDIYNSTPSCTVNIPDINFKAYLVGNTAINTNGDTEIQCSEATAFTGSIDVYNHSISDLTGIEAFTALTFLNCGDNSLNNLNVSQNIALTALYCHQNSLTALDVSNNIVLTQFACNLNALTSLNVANGNNTNIATNSFHANNNPNLTCITVDNVTYSDSTWSIIDAQTSFSINCVNITYVNQVASGQVDGTTWADAYTHLENALAAAADGDVIWVATGTYLPNTSALINTPFSVNNADLKIYGGFSGTETQLSDRVLGTNETILSGDFQGNDVFVNDHFTNSLYHSSKTDNSRNIINITALANNLVLDGLTISSAHNSVNNIEGGAIIKEKTVAKLTIKNCTIKNNIAALAAPGIFARFELNNVGGTRGELIIKNSKFINNMSRYASGVYAFAITNTLLDIKVENSLFNNNIAGNTSTGVRGLSGAASWFRSIGASSNLDLKLINNTYVNHIDDSDGNGINNNNRAVVAINTSSRGVLNAEVVNCIFWNNYKPAASNIAVRSITNTYQDAAQSIVVKNSIDQLNFNHASITSTVNTSSSNPLFVNINSNLVLQTGSPAIDTGDNSYVTTSSDLLGNQRIFNSIVDMGCYEFGSSPLGVETNVTLLNFKLYPNPVRNTLNIQLEETLAKVEVYSILGTKVLESTNSSVNVSNLSSGMYLLKVYAKDGKVGVKRFVKE